MPTFKTVQKEWNRLDTLVQSSQTISEFKETDTNSETSKRYIFNVHDLYRVKLLTLCY